MKLARLWEKYLLSADHDEHEHPIDVKTPVPALVVWASGAITGEALATMAEQLLGIDRRATTATMVASLRIAGDPEQLESLYCIHRRGTCMGAGEVWWRLHLPSEHEPECLFCLPNPLLPEARRQQKYWSFRENAAGDA